MSIKWNSPLNNLASDKAISSFILRLQLSIWEQNEPPKVATTILG